MKAAIIRTVCAILCVVFIMITAGCTDRTKESQSAETASETISTDKKDQLDAVLSNNSFKGVVQITKGGDVIYQYVDGNDDNKQPLTIDASMPIGSVSKQFCAACVMLLCEQKKLSVDDTLERYFPTYRYGDKLTIKNLLNMSSGIKNHLELVDPKSLGADEQDNVDTIKKAIFDAELQFDPGDDYGYSNSNYFLLAEIVEQVSGVPYHEYLRTNFLEPLEMTHTGFTYGAAGDSDRNFTLSEASSTQAEFYNPGLTKGAGDMVSNAADMDRWMRGLSGGKVISTDAFRQMTQDVNPYSSEEYCYGFWHMSYGGAGHVGQIPPHFGAVDYINTDRDVYLFAVSNTGSGMSYVQQIPSALLKILFEDK